MLVALLARGFLLGLIASAPAAPPARPAPDGFAESRKAAGPRAVQTLLVDWTDAQRNRPVPAKIYYPADGKGPFPIVIFSHGLGGSREGYAYLGRHWASHGYVSVHVEHEGSDDAVWRGQAKVAEQMQKAAKDPENAVNRPKDVSLAIDQMERLQAEQGPLKDRLALDRIAVAGHSFGAFTALAVAGEAGTHVSESLTLADERVRAAIPMSSPVPFRRKDYDEIYAPIAIPCLHMTGTQDESPIAFTKAENRRIPYDHINKADQYLVTFVGGDHAIFSGRPRRGQAAPKNNPAAQKDAVFQGLIRASTTAFLDAYLKSDAKAKTWLQNGGLETALGNNAKLEQKRPTTQPAEHSTGSTE